MKSRFLFLALVSVCASHGLLAQTIFLQQLDNSAVTPEFERASFNLGSPSVSQPAGTKFVQIELDHMRNVDVPCYIGDSMLSANTFNTGRLVEFSDSGYTNPVAFYLNTGGAIQEGPPSGTKFNLGYSNVPINAGHFYQLHLDCSAAGVQSHGAIAIKSAAFDPNNAIFFIFSDGNPPVIAPPIIGATGGPTNQQLPVSEPISTGNGNYYYQPTDFVIPGRGMPLVFQRTYNALDNYSGPLGANWTHSFNIILSVTTTGAVIKWGDGHGETFTLSGGNYISQPGVFNTLLKNGDGTFALTQKNQARYNFSAAGGLTSIADKNGNMAVLTYDLAGNLSQVTDTVGRAVLLAYDTSNRITQITDPSARSVLFSYDASNNLVQTTDPAGGVTTYAYDTNHRVTSITLPNGQTLLQNTYDSSGRAISQTGGRGFSTTLSYGTPNPGDTTITDARGNQTIHTYDASLRIVKITDATGGITSFTYDANNNRTSVANQNGKTTSFTYDVRGNITGITDPLTNPIAFTYDTKNNLLTATNAKAKTTTFTYDVKGNLKTIQDALGNTTTFGYDILGQLTSKTDARDNTTTFTYDSSGNLSRITDALGNGTTLSYDGIGRLTSITDPNGHTATATYDALSRLVRISDPLGNQTQFLYDALGNLLRITDAKGNATNYAYDATNNLVSVTDALGRVTRYGYDANNSRTSFTNAKGNVTSYIYSALNRLVRITDPLSFATAYAYDPVGNVLATTDAKAQTNQFTYDALNRLLAISYADGKSVAYSYDANGNRTSMVDSHGTTTYSYDDLDRLTSVAHPGGKVVAYAYDAVGNRQSLAYPDDKTVNYSYDAANRLSQVNDWLGRISRYSYDQASNLLGTTYPNQAALSLVYDAANRLLQVRNSYRGSSDLPLNPVTSFTYLLDAVGNRLKVTDGSGKATQYGYDKLNQLTSVTKDTKVTKFTYDVVGNRVKLTAPGTSITYTYDAADRLLSADTATFTYDANGNQTSKTQTATGQPFIYTYDAANRLVSVTGGAANNSFAYDGDGNRISQTVGAGTYIYVNDVATALPVVLQELGPDGNISYTYGLGLVSGSGPAFDFFYHYDGLGSIVGLTGSSGKLLGRYAFDAWGQADLSVPEPKIGTKNKFRFTGEALDPGTGLYYLRARYYDSTIGRFLSGDPFRGISAFPLSKNLYLYALGNPVSYRDPSGLFVIFAAEFGEAISAADRAYSTNMEFSRLCYSGDIETCTPEIQQQRQRDTKVAVREIGDVAAAAPGVIYNPALTGLPKSEGAKLLQRVMDLPGKLSWVYSKWQEIFGVDPAYAPQNVPDRCSATPAECVNSLALSPPTTKTNK